jgi:ADP-ribose pyrophosphatase YjhB (NUDIX family)
VDEEIRIRACLAVVREGQILLVPHYGTDAGPEQWTIPGGRVAFGEGLRAAAVREFEEETGLQAEVTGLLDVSEVILPERPWHSITVTFSGRVAGGVLAPEAGHRHGRKVPRWFSAETIEGIPVHPEGTVWKALVGEEGRDRGQSDARHGRHVRQRLTTEKSIEVERKGAT